MSRVTRRTKVVPTMPRARSGANEGCKAVAAEYRASPRRYPAALFYMETGASKATTMLGRRLPARMATDGGSSDVSRIRRAT